MQECMDKNIFEILLIANTAEAFKKALLDASHEEMGKRRISHELALSQRAFFWESDNKVVITPHAIPEDLMAHNSKVLGFYTVLNLAPKEDRIDLCRAILDDQSLWSNIVRIIKENPGIAVSPYAVTHDFLFLIEALRKESLDFHVPELPEHESIWTIEHLDSKSGFRNQLSSLISNNSSTLYLPKGFVCKDMAHAIEVGRWFINQDRSCVIKSNFGESGWGVLVCRKEQFKALIDFEHHVRIALVNDTIWNQLPLVVEEFIDPLLSIAGGMPSGEAFVTSAGVEFKYACGQEINKNGEFLGITLGIGILPAILEEKIRLATEEIGRAFFKLGYRGFFDVDFVLDRSGNIYAIESNMRRTGGTHVYDLKQWIMKSNPRSKEPCVFSHDSLVYSTATVLSPAEVLHKTKNLLYPMEGKPAGIVISLLNPKEPVIGYMIVGEDKKQVDVIKSAFLDIWAKDY